jgi:hypothetical protein
MDLLRDQVWTFISASLTLLSMFAGVIYFFIQKKKKIIGYKIISNFPLFSIHDKKMADDKLSIRYDGKDISNLHICTIEVSNKGNMSIESKDFEEPLKVSFGDQSNLINTEIIKTAPSEFKPKLKVDNDSFELAPCLLNPGDRFLVKIILQNFDLKKFKISARISGVKNIKQEITFFNEPKPGWIFVILGIFILLAQSFIPKFELKIFYLLFDSRTLRGTAVMVGAIYLWFGMLPLNQLQRMILRLKKN